MESVQDICRDIWTGSYSRRKLEIYTGHEEKWKPEAYMESMMEQIPFICRDIVKLPLPIDLYGAYGEYHYGVIFKYQLNL